MDDVELRTEAMRPFLNTTTRALWRTASTSHFFACKVWIFRSFNAGVFFGFFSMHLLCVGFMEFKGGGVLLLFQRGELKNIWRGRGGGILLNPPPFFTLHVSPPSRNNLSFRRARDGIFLPLKKTHLKNIRVINSFCRARKLFPKDKNVPH
jgi:hypothetical protein